MSNVNHPAHYNKGKIEVIDIMESVIVSMDLTPREILCTATALKYLCRWKNKGGKEDLEKAVWYIERMVKDDSAEV